MGLLWVCYGSSTNRLGLLWGLLWVRYGVCRLLCHGYALGMLWACYGRAMGCHGFAICMVLTRHAHPTDALRKYAIDVLRGRAHRPRTRHPRRRRCAIDMLCECHGCAICLLLICYGGGRMAYATDMLGA